MTLGELYFSVNGRVGRSTLWLKYMLPATVIQLIAVIIAGADREASAVLSLIVGLVLLWPGIAVQLKRWHDRDKSAWWLLFGLIPVVGWIWSLVELGFVKGTEGPNRFGSDPLA